MAVTDSSTDDGVAVGDADGVGVALEPPPPGLGAGAGAEYVPMVCRNLGVDPLMLLNAPAAMSDEPANSSEDT